MAEQQKILHKRTSATTFIERLKANNFTTIFDDEEVLYDRLGEDYDDAENQLAEYKKHEDELALQPTHANSLLNSWRKGADPAECILYV